MIQKRNKRTKIIIILAILLILLVSYIGFQSYQQYVQKQQLDIFQQGAQYGYQQAVIQVVQQATTCQQVPLKVQDKTINIIAVECLKK